MPEITMDEQVPATSGFVEVVTNDRDGAVISYRLVGSKPGPHVVVCGCLPLIEALHERLSLVPTVPWIWGVVHLLSLDAFDEPHSQAVHGLLSYVRSDETIMLPYVPVDGKYGDAEEQGYRSVLRLCSKLGMITGRGVR